MSFCIKRFFLGKIICLTFISWNMISIGISKDTLAQENDPLDSIQNINIEKETATEELSKFENAPIASRSIMESIAEEAPHVEQNISISHLIKSSPIAIPSPIQSPRSPKFKVAMYDCSIHSSPPSQARARGSSSASLQPQGPRTGILPVTIENRRLNRVRSQDIMSYIPEKMPIIPEKMPID